ncbi:MAG TPA: hypothetical protein VGJ16_06205, partial [Pirellulales bacterium]
PEAQRLVRVDCWAAQSPDESSPPAFTRTCTFRTRASYNQVSNDLAVLAIANLPDRVLRWHYGYMAHEFAPASRAATQGT